MGTLLLTSVLVTITLSLASEPNTTSNVDNKCTQSCDNEPTEPSQHLWTIVDGMCRVFPNRCTFDLTNCRRKYSCQHRMIAIPKWMCQQKCVACCDEQPKQEICATRCDSKERTTFRNPCEMYGTACCKAQPYCAVVDGACPGTSGNGGANNGPPN